MKKIFLFATASFMMLACSDPKVQEDLKLLKEDLAKTKEDLTNLRKDHAKLLKDLGKAELQMEDNLEGSAIDQ